MQEDLLADCHPLRAVAMLAVRIAGSSVAQRAPLRLIVVASCMMIAVSIGAAATPEAPVAGTVLAAAARSMARRVMFLIVSDVSLSCPAARSACRERYF
jgi:hypothetical protein